MFNRLDRYIVRQVLGPLIMTLSIAAMLLLLERMLRLFDFVVNQGGPVEVVFRMLGSLVPHNHCRAIHRRRRPPHPIQVQWRRDPEPGE